MPSDTSYYTAAIGTGLVGSGLRPTENCRRLSAASVEASSLEGPSFEPLYYHRHPCMEPLLQLFRMDYSPSTAIDPTSPV